MPARYSSAVSRWALEQLQRRLGNVPLRVSLNGFEKQLSDEPPVAHLQISGLGKLLAMARAPELAFGDGYSDGSIRLEGDLLAALEAVYRSLQRRPRGWRIHFEDALLRMSQRNTEGGSRRNIHHHYDIRTDFYQLWLDRELLYTCAYFPTPDASLEDAQTAKMDHVARKLKLQPGEKVVEAGCGWGALALHLARNYGVSVRAYNVSHEQIAYAQRRARLLGLSDRVEFVEDDYRNIDARYDVFVSVGMLEHVGRANYDELGRVIRRAIGGTGRGFLHFIGRNRPAPLSVWIRKRIFPGAYPPTLKEMLDILAPANFAVLDVENLRMHYAKTLEHWLQRFEHNRERVESMFDEEFVRAWRLYLAGSLAAFRVGTLQLFQVLFAGPECPAIPWTRAHVYDQTTAASQPQEALSEQWTAAT
jgi:cyclopropane-fatty-acyl-phospholipid synthase